MTDSAGQVAPLLSAVRAEPKLLYVDQWARRLNWTVAEVMGAAEELQARNAILVLHAPLGALLCLCPWDKAQAQAPERDR